MHRPLTVQNNGVLASIPVEIAEGRRAEDLDTQGEDGLDWIFVQPDALT